MIVRVFCTSSVSDGGAGLIVDIFGDEVGDHAGQSVEKGVGENLRKLQVRIAVDVVLEFNVLKS